MRETPKVRACGAEGNDLKHFSDELIENTPERLVLPFPTDIKYEELHPQDLYRGIYIEYFYELSSGKFAGDTRWIKYKHPVVISLEP